MTANETISLFKKEYGYLEEKGLTIIGVFEAYSSSGYDLTMGLAEELDEDEDISYERAHISVMYPFIFDGRKIPQEFYGIKIFRSISESTVPKEIDEFVTDPSGYKANWTPKQFHDYIVYYADEIREALDDPKLLLGELLDAICLGSYEKIIDQYEEERYKHMYGKASTPPQSAS